jgi:hypothetical protein
MVRRALLFLCALGIGGCEAPVLLNDGSIAFPEKGLRGAGIVTANGVEFRDRNDVPQRIIHHSTDDPWRAPVGFILPKSGRFTQTSQPTVIATRGLAFSLRSSDTRVPSWGGEVLVRVDVIAPAAEGTARAGEGLAIVIDGSGVDSLLLAEDALEQLGAWDRVAVIDASPARVLVPSIPANDRSLAEAALEKQMHTLPRGASDLAKGLRLARGSLGGTGLRRVLILTDGKTPPDARAQDAIAELSHEGVVTSAIGTRDDVDAWLASGLVTAGGISHVHPSLDSRRAAVRFVVPSAGMVTFKNTILEFRGNPAPSHVIETSGGGVRWHLDSGELVLGDIRAGEARTEVIRVTVPPFTPGLSFDFEVSAHAHDVQLGDERSFGADIHCVYDDDLERIAQSRNGDVIAYASALATLKRLEAAFAGPDVERAGGIWQIARLHAQSMSLLARDTGDRAIAEQADTLRAVVGTVGPN